LGRDFGGNGDSYGGGMGGVGERIGARCLGIGKLGCGLAGPGMCAIIHKQRTDHERRERRFPHAQGAGLEAQKPAYSAIGCGARLPAPCCAGVCFPGSGAALRRWPQRPLSDSAGLALRTFLVGLHHLSRRRVPDSRTCDAMPAAADRPASPSFLQPQSAAAARGSGLPNRRGCEHNVSRTLPASSTGSGWLACLDEGRRRAECDEPVKESGLAEAGVLFVPQRVCWPVAVQQAKP
jgi:hypothetical protein